MKKYHIFVSGFVQGVGFRWYARDIAKELGLLGYVKNLFDGRVEVVAEGKEDILQKFILELKKGSLAENIDGIETQEEDPDDEFTDFRIK